MAVAQGGVSEASLLAVMSSCAPSTLHRMAVAVLMCCSLARQERERAQAEEVEDARQAAHDANEAFAHARQVRHDTFVRAFEHVAERIDGIYKDLTCAGPPGALVGARGSAYLVLQDRDSPYLGGITYSAMPPSKRFRDMDQLSGGEKVRKPPSHRLEDACILGTLCKHDAAAIAI